MRVRKAVFPAAGWGTRFLPATKAQPKEMLPLVDKPIIQYAVEEAVAAGSSRSSSSPPARSGRSRTTSTCPTSSSTCSRRRATSRCSARSAHISDLAQVAYVRQKEQLGPRPRGADGQGPDRPRAVRGDPPRRRGRRRSAVHRPADPRLQPDARLGRRGHGGPPRGDQPLRRHRRASRPRTRSTTAGCTGHPARREAAARRRAVEPGDHRPLRPDAEDLRQARADASAAPAARSS